MTSKQAQPFRMLPAKTKTKVQRHYADLHEEIRFTFAVTSSHMAEEIENIQMNYF